MSMSQHAPLAPSSANRWVPCPGSVLHEAMYPEVSVHPMTLEGSAIHEIAAKVLEDFMYHERKGHSFNRLSFLNTTANNGVVITADMLDVAEMYIRDVMEVSKRFDGLAKVMVEHRVYMRSIHPDNWGTLDAAIIFYDMSAKELVVEDLKAGWGVVEVWDNWQLIDYSIGLLTEMVERNWPLPEVIEFRLVQPRPYHRHGPIRVQRIALKDLEPYVEKLRASAHEAFAPNPRFQTGEHCDHCRGRATCPALLQTNYRINEVLQGIQSQDLTGASLGKHLIMLEEAETLLKALNSALRDKALIEVQNGRAVEGWEWISKDSRVNWTIPIEKVHAAGDLYGINLRKVDAPTPKQAITAGMPENVVKTMSASGGKGIALARADMKVSANIFKPTEK